LENVRAHLSPKHTSASALRLSLAISGITVPRGGRRKRVQPSALHERTAFVDGTDLGIGHGPADGRPRPSFRATRQISRSRSEWRPWRRRRWLTP